MSGHKQAPKHHEEEGGGESAPLWIISFCDLALCMLSFFVILSAGNTKNIAYDPEFAELVAAIKKAFKYLPPVPASQTSADDLKKIVGSLKMQKGKSGKSAKPGEASRRVDGMAGKNDLVTSIRPGTQTTIGGVITFGQSGTELSEDAVSAVRQIAEKIRGHMVVFMVKGHTSRDEEYALRDSKRDLSYERAEAVVRKLVEMGVSREGLRTQACRDYEPIREGAYSEQTRGANRRVEVIATEALVCEYRGGDPSTKRNYQINELGRRLEKQLNDRNITTPAHQPEAHAADHD